MIACAFRGWLLPPTQPRSFSCRKALQSQARDGRQSLPGRHSSVIIRPNLSAGITPIFRETADFPLRRDVAQPGRALAWGARGRQFKSARPDHFISPNTILLDTRQISGCRQRSAGARIKACEGRGREILRLRARWRFAQDFACGLPLGFASLTPANRLKFKSARPDH
jgi:hypothetical protein